MSVLRKRQEAELAISVFLVAGLLPRLNVVTLFMLNPVAAISYPDIRSTAEKKYLIWGLMTIVLFFYDTGIAFIEFFLRKKMLST